MERKKLNQDPNFVIHKKMFTICFEVFERIFHLFEISFLPLKELIKRLYIHFCWVASCKLQLVLFCLE